MNTVEDAIAYLRSPQAIRRQSDRLFQLACQDRLHYFRCNLEQLAPVTDYVIQITTQSYPDLDIPFHSRWRHFETGGVLRLAQLDRQLVALSPLEKCKAKFDLVIISVLLDAGAGSTWQYREAETGKVFRRSEGLAVASLRAFCAGVFSSHPQFPLQADPQGLQALTVPTLAQAFQVSADNPLVGLEGRVELLQRLGKILLKHAQQLGTQNPRPGDLVNLMLGSVDAGEISAVTILQVILEVLGEIWAGRLSLGGVNLGDVWIHPALSPKALGGQYIPFHKLSLWLTYSLLEPLAELGLKISQLEQLPGLAEYRNGGLCLDGGLLQLKQPQALQVSHLPSAEIIVEWRALTISLLDRIAETMRTKLQLSPQQFPLVKVLQGGTWSAGRQLASQLRPDGVPPLQITSDGTVF